MNAVERLGSYISGPFHPFGGAVDIIVVEQQDGSFKTSPWYVRFGKFQGVLKTKEKVVNISVNGVDANFHMYLDHKGKAYFLKEVEVEEGESVLYQSSSGEDTEVQSNGRRPVKSLSCDYDATDQNSGSQIDVNNGKIVTRTGSGRGRILGLVFGRKSKNFREDKGDPGMVRASSLERAEIAADLLEVKWSTNLATSRKASVGKATHEERAFHSGIEKKLDERDVSSCHGVSDEIEMDIVQSSVHCETSESSRLGLHGFGGQSEETLYLSHGECEEVRAHAEILHETTENISELNSLPVCGILVAKESSHNVDNMRDVDNEKIVESEVISMNSVRHNSNESLSSVDVHLIASNSVETEVLGVNVIHHAMITKRNADDINTEAEVWDVPGDHSRRTNSCTSSVLDYDDMEFNEPTMVPESYIPTVKTEVIPGSVEEAKLPSIGTVSGFSNLVHQVKEDNNVTNENDGPEIQLCQGLNISPSESSEEEQFLFSDLDDLKLSEAKCTESISPDLVEKIVIHSLTLVGTEAVKESSSINYESCSSSDKCVQDNLPNDVEDLVENPRQMSCPIDIFGRHEDVGERVGRMVESLPNLWSHVDDLGALGLRHPYNSLDLDTKSSKWTLLRKNVSTCIKLDAEEKRQLAEGRLTTGDNQISGQLINVPLNPAVGDLSKAIVASSGSWRMWPFSLKRSRTLNAVQPGLDDTKCSDVEDDPESTTGMSSNKTELKPKATKQNVRSITPTSEQLASLNLKEGRNTVTFTFSTPMLGKQQVDARIYLWKWNTRIVISDVDGTITKSDVLGQFMPWVGVDWSHTGVTHLFSAIKENGYQLLFLSARAISQAYVTRQFLFNLKQDGKALPDGPVVISPDGLFPSLFREVIRRAPHEFKIACLEDIKALFPSDCSPFYAGFGNRDTDEISYRKVGIPKGKIFIINPKGEVAVNRRVDTKSYPSLHALVQDMFPPMSSTEQEDFNSWNFWKLPPPVLGG